MNEQEIDELIGPVSAQEDEKYLQYAVPRKNLLRKLRSPNNRFIIINAPRGCGKSGLMISHSNDMTNVYKNKAVVLMKYFDDIVFPNTNHSVAEYTNFWKNTILSEIVKEVGARLKGVVWRDDDLVALEMAELQGRTEKNPIDSLLSRLKFKSIPVEKIEVDPQLSYEQIQRIIKKSDTKFYVVLDEMDVHYADNENANNSLVGLMHACENICRNTENVWLRMTIRPHILKIISSKYDIVQKLTRKIHNIKWENRELKEILAKRIEVFDDYHEQFALEREEVNDGSIDKEKEKEELRQHNLISRYFEDFDMSLSPDSKSNYRAFSTMGFRKPRWMLEFCISALMHSKGRFADKKAYRKAVYEYGSQRVTWLAGEHFHHMPHLEKIINQISGERRIALGKNESLKSMIINCVLDAGVAIEYIDDKIKDRDNALALASLQIANELYMVDFIRGKQRLGGRDDHRFFYFSDRPELLSSWSKNLRIEWEIHPVFALGLNIIDNNVIRDGDELRMIGERGRRRQS